MRVALYCIPIVLTSTSLIVRIRKARYSAHCCLGTAAHSTHPDAAAAIRRAALHTAAALTAKHPDAAAAMAPDDDDAGR